jgi:hypothetical protein
MDSVEAREIVDVLNKPPFSKEFSLIGFDAQEPLQLLQVRTTTTVLCPPLSLFVVVVLLRPPCPIPQRYTRVAVLLLANCHSRSLAQLCC